MTNTNLQFTEDPLKSIEREAQIIRDSRQSPKEVEQNQREQEAQNMKERVKTVLRDPDTETAMKRATSLLLEEYGQSEEEAQTTISKVLDTMKAHEMRMDEYRDRISELKKSNS